MKKDSVKFKKIDLRLVYPSFDSKLTDLIIKLNYLRKKSFINGTTPPGVFIQLKKIFHLLESLGSARIEGNRTTIAELIEAKLDNKIHKDEKIREIQNNKQALTFIDKNIDTIKINRGFISELHKRVVADLTPPPKGEGSKDPGGYRRKNVQIKGAKFLPPDYTCVKSYMQELFAFINKRDSAKYDLLKTAISHHRFVWIHPFDNGNGRVVRLLTYAMLVKQGFNVNLGRIINPTAIFCNNRQKYYKLLAQADTGKKKFILQWCEYVLKGLKKEMDKINKLLDYDYLAENILLPTIDLSFEKKLITPVETKILSTVAKKGVIQASDIRKIFPDKLPSAISRMIRKLRNKEMLTTKMGKSRKYILSFENNYLLRGIIRFLDENGFLPISRYE